MKKNFMAIIAIMMLCAMLGCGIMPSKIPDEPVVPETSAPSPVIVSPEPTEEVIDITPTEGPVVEATESPVAQINHEYHIEQMPYTIFRTLNVVILSADWYDHSIYACMAADGEMYYYVFAHDEATGEHGLLRVTIEAGDPVPVVTIDEETGFTGFPTLATCDTAETAGAADLCFA